MLLLAGFGMQIDPAIPTAAAAYTGLAQIEGPVQLDIAISPPVGAPRDTMQVQLQIRNRTPETAVPTILLSFPQNLQPDVKQLPRGVTVNLQANTIQWLPVLESGQGLELSLPLRVESVDLTSPEQEVTAVLHHNGQEKSTQVTLWTGVPPQIESVLSQSHVAVGQSYQLKAEISGPGPFTQEWDLGDGRRVAVNDPLVVYPTAGIYTVSLVAKNPLGEAASSAQITVVPHVAAQFGIDDDTPGVGQSIAFHNDSGGQGPLQYTWQFGDGTTSQEAAPQHEYQQPGIYEVSLVVENSLGLAQAFGQVTVGLPPAADMFVVDSAPAGEPLFGQAISDETTAVAWEMGDGRIYQGAEINHAYNRSGDYYVTMIAENEFGTTRLGKWIHVGAGILKSFLPLITKPGDLNPGSSGDAVTDPLGLDLEAVDLEEAFVLESLDLPANSTPAEQLFIYVNAARAKFDLPPLESVAALNSAAAAHAADMAAFQHTNHSGSDGSHPSERLIYHGYERGYAGEATAWGFADPRYAVEFWVNSDSHRPIILNQYATDLGVAFVEDYSAPSVWYWTAEFGNKFSSAWQPTLRLHNPQTDLSILNTEMVSFNWNWPKPLAAGEQFVLVMHGNSGSVSVGTINRPLWGTRYGFILNPLDFPELIGNFDWSIRLENGGVLMTATDLRTITIEPDPTLPTATPIPTLVPTVAITPDVTTTVMPTPSAAAPSPTPRATQEPPPVLITATPLPTPEN
ncbi:MAG: PKD domain-containing protein [Anaerolineales bacterium]|nr:PKD domain-containing protein [Anaerolineales bacterium]